MRVYPRPDTDAGYTEPVTPNIPTSEHRAMAYEIIRTLKHRQGGELCGPLSRATNPGALLDEIAYIIANYY